MRVCVSPWLLWRGNTGTWNSPDQHKVPSGHPGNPDGAQTSLRHHHDVLDKQCDITAWLPCPDDVMDDRVLLSVIEVWWDREEDNLQGWGAEEQEEDEEEVQEMDR